MLLRRAKRNLTGSSVPDADFGDDLSSKLMQKG